MAWEPPEIATGDAGRQLRRLTAPPPVIGARGVAGKGGGRAGVAFAEPTSNHRAGSQIGR